MGILGAHVSAAGGVHHAPKRGSDIDADSIQIFTANQNQWFPKQPSREDAAQFQAEMKRERPQTCVSHASYLLNLGSPEGKKLSMSRKAFIEEMDRCDACGIPFVVFHPGSHMKTGEAECLIRIAESLDHCIDKRPDSRVTLLIENTAGQGSTVGYKFEHLAEIIKRVKHRKRVGVCIDTQHSFAAGYDIRRQQGWDDTFDHFDRTVGLEWIRVFHVNDSRRELGTRVDRHGNIGRGFLSEETFWCLVNDKRFADLPMILETPAKSPSVYSEELRLLRGLIGVKKPG